MTLNCPVCERSIEPDNDRHCPVCESDLSALVLYRQSRAHQIGVAGAAPPAGLRRYGWVLFLVALILLLPMFFILGQRSTPKPPAALQTVIVTATTAATDSPTPTRTLTRTPTATTTVTPSTTPTPTATTTRLPPPALEAQANLNCRAGPGPGYPVVGYLPRAQSQPVLAARNDGIWLMIPHPQQEGLACWVWAEGVTLTGSLDRVPQILPSR